MQGEEAGGRPSWPATQPMAALAVCFQAAQSASVASSVALLPRHVWMIDMAARVQASISPGSFTVMAATLRALFHAAIRASSNASMYPRFHALWAIQHGRIWNSGRLGTRLHPIDYHDDSGAPRPHCGLERRVSARTVRRSSISSIPVAFSRSSRVRCRSGSSGSAEWGRRFALGSPKLRLTNLVRDDLRRPPGIQIDVP
jgi:hypothetical protein